jgi:hypothetical protein
MKSELFQPEVLKECFGTKEWSEKSGICSNCKLKKDCGKSSNSRNNVNIVTIN